LYRANRGSVRASSEACAFKEKGTLITVVSDALLLVLALRAA
jgi:hypothetical protein